MEKLIKGNEFFPFPLEPIQPILLNQDRFVLLETQRVDKENYLSYLFFQPISVITCFNLDRIYQAFQQLETFLDKGYWAAGFFSYEMGYAWEDFKANKRFAFPLIWLGIFNQPLIFNHLKGEFISTPISITRGLKNDWRAGKYRITDIRLNEKLPEYIRNIQRIKNYIAQGLTYQVNYTIKCRFKFQGSSLSLYKNLRNAQPVAYSSFIRDREFSLLSFSPELFFRKEGRLVKVRPMKGTISRGRTEKEDRFKMRALKASQKDRSENVMIVDLLRNDLGRISEAGSVRTVKLYTVEKYKTLFQLTSTVQSKLEGNPSVYEIFRSIFPSGSVTGAPKIKTMEIIRELEKRERRVYTGAIGFFKPNRDAVFNVAIRTLLLRGESGEMGIGSGIVYDSDPQREYHECQLKALFFTQKQKEFQLIETMRWSKREGFFLLSWHLDRLKSSADYFNFSFNAKRIKQELGRISRNFNPVFTYRVRLLLSCSGNVSINYQRIKRIPKQGIPKVVFARKKTNSQDIAFYHKTTNRRIYDQEYKWAKSKGFYEVIFENERGEITEGAISNIFIRYGKIYYTPPVTCGLLNGVYRQYLMKKKAPLVKERILRRRDLYQADAVSLTNAVRGMTRVRLL
ncbi:MAG: aminodeoxychorismate synthase component I [Candidatus Omnitrophota bacterium]|jgi:para-aminobenzoate synthetase/4-amino-4-deoxychorismate lyase